MTNLEKYDAAFRQALALDDEYDVTGLRYQAIPSWDSVGHMGLVACLEDSFGFVFDVDDMIDLDSYEKGIELLKKYDIEI
ncbi:MAG: acyl carrier protein [Eubacterium sp.]|nr:acyl carrier protein [Eubacterium sp.]